MGVVRFLTGTGCSRLGANMIGSLVLPQREWIAADGSINLIDEVTEVVSPGYSAMNIIMKIIS